MASRQSIALLASQLGDIAQLRLAEAEKAQVSLIDAQSAVRAADEGHAKAISSFAERMEQWETQVGSSDPDLALACIFRDAVVHLETLVLAASIDQADAIGQQRAAAQHLALAQARSRLAQEAEAYHTKLLTNRREIDQSLMIEDMMIAAWRRAR